MQGDQRIFPKIYFLVLRTSHKFLFYFRYRHFSAILSAISYMCVFYALTFAKKNNIAMSDDFFGCAESLSNL